MSWSSTVNSPVDNPTDLFDNCAASYSTTITVQSTPLLNSHYLTTPLNVNIISKYNVTLSLQVNMRVHLSPQSHQVDTIMTVVMPTLWKSSSYNVHKKVILMGIVTAACVDQINRFWTLLSKVQINCYAVLYIHIQYIKDTPVYVRCNNSQGV